MANTFDIKYIRCRRGGLSFSIGGSLIGNTTHLTQSHIAKLYVYGIPNHYHNIFCVTNT